MRAVTIGILALLCGGCAAGQFDLVPRDPEAPWLAGPRRVRVESSNTTINASYDGIWLDHLAFMVEVVNQTDSVLVVDPQRFALTLAMAGPEEPYELPAADPASIQAVRYRAAYICPFIGPCRWMDLPAGPDEAILGRLLRRTEVEPGGSVHGEVWVPAWALREAIRLTPTRVASAAGADCQVTLHTPRELGGQEVEFAVATR